MFRNRYERKNPAANGRKTKAIRGQFCARASIDCDALAWQADKNGLLTIASSWDALW
jgi:hypothetical protein